MLPGGAKFDRLSAIAPQLRQSKFALNTLRRVSLVYITPDHIIRVLLPIRSFILDNHKLPNPHLQRLYQCYYELAKWSSRGGRPGFLQIKQAMANEEANMGYILLDALEQEDPRAALVASKYYTWFLYGHIPRTEVILEAIKTSERLGYLDLLSDFLSVKGNIKHVWGHYDIAIHDVTRAKQLYEDLGVQLGVADCMKKLGDLLYLLFRHDEARVLLQDSKTKFEDSGDALGVAQCLQSLGEIFRMQHQNDEAQAFIQDAKAKFAVIGRAVGVAECLMSLGNILCIQHQYDKARASLQDAKTKFEDIGNALGMPQGFYEGWLRA